MIKNKSLGLILVMVVLCGTAEINAGEDRQPVPTYRVPPDYPLWMGLRRINGSVVVEFIIGPDGLVKEARVVKTTDKGFNDAARQAVLRWRFEPGLKGGRPVNCRVQQEFSFSFPLREPVYPFAELQAGRDGTASLGYWLDENKRLKRAVVLKASDPAFGQAALANLEEEYATMKPLHVGRSDGMYETDVYRFKCDGSGVLKVSTSAREILKLLKKSDVSFLTESDLDKPAVPLEQDPPLFPLSLRDTHQTGTAIVEYFIDRKGHAQLPRVVSASHENFGYAAVQAVGQWQFAPPLKKGKPVVVRTQVAIDFSLDAAAKLRPNDL